MKYRIKEYFSSESIWFRAQVKVLGLWWDVSETVAFTKEQCEYLLCKKLINKKKYPKYHEVNCE